MNNEGLRIIEDVTTLPGLQWVEAPMGAENSLRMQLPEPGNYSQYFEDRSDRRGKKLTDAGRRLVNANWHDFRNLGGMEDSWEAIKSDPDQIGNRIINLEQSRVELFKSLRESTSNDEAHKLIDLMERSFEARIRGMEITRLNAEMEAGNSPWAAIIEETGKRFVNGQEDDNLRRGAALSHIQAKRRRIEAFVSNIVETDERFSSEDYGNLRTHIENMYVEKVKAGFATILPANMENLGIDGLDDIVGRSSANQVGTSIEISEFFDQSADEFLADKKQGLMAKVQARHIEAPRRNKLSTPAKVALGGAAVIIAASVIGSMFLYKGSTTPNTDLQNALHPRNDRPAYVENYSNTQHPKYVAPHANKNSTINPITPALVETNPRDEGDEILAPPATPAAMNAEIIDAGQETNPVEQTTLENFHDWVFEIDGVDFSQDYQMTIPAEWSRLLSLNDRDYTYALDASAQLENREPTEDDFSYSNNNPGSVYAISSHTHHENLVVQGHSYPIFISGGNASREDGMLSDWPFELIRRAVERSIEEGKIPEDLSNTPITITQNGKVMVLKIVGASIVPAKDFRNINIYSDNSLPATLTIGEGGINLTSENSVGNEGDISKPGTIFLSTCYGIPNWKGEYPQRAVGTFKVVVVDPNEGSHNDAVEAPSEDAEINVTAENASPTFAEAYGTDFQTQYLSELSTTRPELVQAYESGKHSRIFLNMLFSNYSPAVNALNKFIEDNHIENMPNMTREEKLTLYLYTQRIVTGASVDNYLKIGRSDSQGSSYGIFIPSQVVPGAQWIRYDGIMYRSNEVSPMVVVDETFQPLLYNELVSDNEEALRRWGYDEHTTSDALTSSNLRAFLEFIEKFFMAQNNFKDKSYEFIINGVTTNDPTVAGTELAKYLTNLLDRTVTTDEILSLVNQEDFNRLMDEGRAKGINIEELIGMKRDGTTPLRIEAKYPPVVAATNH